MMAKGAMSLLAESTQFDIELKLLMLSEVMQEEIKLNQLKATLKNKDGVAALGLSIEQEPEKEYDVLRYVS